MTDAGKPRRRPRRRWFRWLRLAAFLTLISAAAGSAALLYFYYNLTELVVWFANRVHPELVAEIKRAAFASPHRIEINGFSLKLRNSNEQVLGMESTGIDFTWHDLWHHRIASIQVVNPQVFVSDRLLAIPLANQQGTPAAKAAPLTSPDGLWLVDEFKVTGGKAGIDLKRSPVIRFDFDSTMRSIYLSPEVRFSTQTQTAAVRNVEFLSRDAKPVRFGAIQSVTAHFSLNGIAGNKIDDLAIQTPSIRLTPGLLAMFSVPDPAGAPAAQGSGTAPSAPAPPVSAAPFVIGKIHLADGQFLMKDFGGTVPETSCKFAMDEQDLQIGASPGDLLEKPHKLQIWDVRSAAAFARLNPFLWIGSTEIDFTAGGLFARREFDGVTLTKIDFHMGTIFRSFLAGINKTAPSQPSARAVAPSPTSAPGAAAPWKIKNLHLVAGNATIADLGAELPNINFKLDTDLRDVPLTADVREASKDVQTVEITDLTIKSPQDPFVPVLNFATIRIGFSLAQILDQEIDSVEFESPTIFVGEGLFWYADEWKRRQAAVPPAPAPPVAAAATSPAHAGWRINELSVERGELVIASTNQADVEMPFYFSTEAEDLRFNKLSDLQFKLNLKVPLNNYEFPSYQLVFKQLEGHIDFGLPPGSNARNVVQKFSAAQARWKQFVADKLWLAITYDVNGIYGRFGGAAYEGYINGEFSFFMRPNTPWAGWVSGYGVNLKQVTDILAPQNFQMSSPADFSVEVNGLNHEIERMAGKFKTTAPGSLKISKIDQIIAKLPETWSMLKQGATRISLETLRDFDYTLGDGNFWFVGDTGHLALKMQGPNGSRNFDITLHGN